ncbi:MAG: DNA helicase [Pseudomonadota bacterium]
MQLSAPIYVLKRKAKIAARGNDIALYQALDNVAVEEGFSSWSHLISSSVNESPAREVLSQLKSGDLALIGARPGHGKTLLGLELAASASYVRRKGYFFTLDYHERNVADQLLSIGIDTSSVIGSMVIDTSDEVSADYIITRLKAEREPAIIVVDYLQILDQRRTNPSLDVQIRSLQKYVRHEGAICVMISQIDRSFDLAEKAMPDILDVRLPNPVDLSAFRKRFFLHDGKIHFDQAA